MKGFFAILLFVGSLVSCVPAKKYNELLEKEKKCSEELERYKSSAITNEGKARDLQSRYDLLQKEAVQLRKDTSDMGNRYRLLQIEYDKSTAQLESMERAFDKLRVAGAKETASLQAELEAKNIELQRKEEALLTLESELKTKQQQLEEREQRVNELEEMIRRQDEAAQQLKTKVAAALKGFESQGLSVEYKDGKIYVSMEAKLLFASGSTAVEANGKKALIELAKVLENEKDLEIIVEGHTDTDKLNSSVSPKNNWELSVLRATSVIDILLANSKMEPKVLSAAGRSEFHPVDPSDKAKNRRIEIIIAPDLSELYDLISK
ncbi:MAG: OmpA family protein [Bacteroidota bacterium]|jgi:chemotaxis protein MotB